MPNNKVLSAVTPDPEAPLPQGPVLKETRAEDWGVLERFLNSLNSAIASRRRRAHSKNCPTIVRFLNGFGAIISEYRLAAGIFEVAPLQFWGLGLDDYEFYFGSHVPDLTWCSDPSELVQVCSQISRLRPPG